MTAFLLRDELSSWGHLNNGGLPVYPQLTAFPGVPIVRTILRQIQNDWWIRFS